MGNWQWKLQTHVQKERKFKISKKIDGGFVHFGDNAKTEVVGIRSITLSLSCDLSKIYPVDCLKHNLLSMSQLCDVGDS